MKLIYKKIAALVLTAGLVMTLPAAGITAKADGVTAADPGELYVSFGADLSSSEKATVMDLLGIEESDLEDYTVGEITNEDEHKYLGDYLDNSVIGSRALSSVIVVLGEKGNGIDVKTKNISYCTPGMYTNALITAGIEDADVIVAGPFEITGTAALVGAMKAYSELTGEEISAESMDTAVNELVVTSQMAEGLNADDVEELIAFVKAKVVEGNLDSDEAISEAIDEGAEQLGISITQEEKDTIISLMKKISDLDLDIDSMKKQAEDLFNKLEDMGFDKEEAQGFFLKIINAIKDFFENLFS
ncbi:MAG: DUF1002 domain-containing protein [Lachnospiraceae bacterium]|nr:DUF1002 domain-containing protein [Lachnospiraceae bacterium]MDE6625929.1 DUF1002 domain-containing protein [Lachnospiraceae bacterium]